MEYDGIYKFKISNIIKFIFIMPFLFALFMEVLHLPSIIKYSLDVCWILLLFFLVRNNSRRKNDYYSKILSIWIIGYLTYTIIAYMFKFQSPFYYLWGLRNNFRFYVFFFACIYILRTKDRDKILKLFDYIYWVNLAICLYQFFIQGYRQDLLGGVFGNQTGCNGYLNIFLIIAVTKSIVYYINKKETLYMFIAKFAAALLVAALAELKFFYVEMIVIVVVAVLQTGFSWQKVFIILFFYIGLYLGLQLLAYYFPASDNSSYSIIGLIQGGASAKGYTAANDFNRLTGVSIINQKFLNTLPEKMFGLGLGNCDSNLSYEFLITPFAKLYTHLHYGWFMLSFSYLEVGIIGMIFIFGFFFLVFVFARKKMKNRSVETELCQISIIMSVCAIILIIYNASLRTEAGYMLYFVLSLPFIENDRIKLNSFKEVK